MEALKARLRTIPSIVVPLAVVVAVILGGVASQGGQCIDFGSAGIECVENGVTYVFGGLAVILGGVAGLRLWAGKSE